MNNTQFYLSIGLPIIAVLASLVISLFQISGVREDIREIRADIKPLAALPAQMTGLKDSLHAEMAGQKDALHAEMAGFKADMGALKNSQTESKETLRAEIHSVNVELTDFKETLRAEMRAQHAETLTAIAGMLDRQR